MATIIDSLLVTLGLDGSKFNAGRQDVKKSLGELRAEADRTAKAVDFAKKSGASAGEIKRLGAEAQKAAKALQDAAKAAGNGFENVAKSAASFLAVIGGTVAIQRFIADVISSGAALDRLSQNLGASANDISAWSNAAELAGGSADGLQGTFDMLNKSQTEMQLTGQSALIPYLSSLGVAMADAAGKARPVNDILLDLADRFERMDRPTANNMGRMMGIDQGTMQLLLKGRAEVEATIRKQKEHGAVTKAQAEQASRLQKVMIDGRQQFAAFGRELLSSATPALEKLLSMLSGVGEWIGENKEVVQTFLTILAAGLVAVGLAMTPVNLTAAAVLGLVAAVSLLWQDYQTWKRGGESFIDWAKWEPGFRKAGEAINWLKNLTEDLVYRTIAAGDILAAVWNKDWARAKFAMGEFVKGTGKKYGEPAAAVAPTGSPAVPSAATPSDKGRERAALDYFQSQGWNKEQSAGIVANLKRESAFKADAVGDNGKAYGLAQWHPDRQAEFKRTFGKDMKGSSFEDQLAFVHHELTAGQERGAGAKLRQATTAADAAAVVSNYYERPSDKAGEATKRGQMAAELYASRPGPLAGIPGASAASQGVGAAAAAQLTQAASAPAVTQEGDKHVETHIGEIKVYTSATDAGGIARDMGKSMDFLFTSQANYGLIP